MGKTQPHKAEEQERAQVTPLLAESLFTVAVKVCIVAADTFGLVGDTETVMAGGGGGGGGLDPPPHPSSTKTPANKPTVTISSGRRILVSSKMKGKAVSRSSQVGVKPAVGILIASNDVA